MLAAMMIEPDSRAAWNRLLLCLALSTIGGAGMWSVIVVIPAIQTSFAEVERIARRYGAQLPAAPVDVRTIA